MSVLRMGIEEQVVKNEWGKENQAGFTEGARIENNILILKYCVEKSFIKNALIVISVDLAKAFDSIRRDVMVEILTDYKINEKAINVTTKLYYGDLTKVKLNENEGLQIPVSSGIREGCRINNPV